MKFNNKNLGKQKGKEAETRHTRKLFPNTGKRKGNNLHWEILRNLEVITESSARIVTLSVHLLTSGQLWRINLLDLRRFALWGEKIGDMKISLHIKFEINITRVGSWIEVGVKWRTQRRNYSSIFQYIYGGQYRKNLELAGISIRRIVGILQHIWQIKLVDFKSRSCNGTMFQASLRNRVCFVSNTIWRRHPLSQFK